MEKPDKWFLWYVITVVGILAFMVIGLIAIGTGEEFEIYIKNIGDEPTDVSLYVDGECVLKYELQPYEVAYYIVNEDFWHSGSSYYSVTIVSDNTTQAQEVHNSGEIWFIVGV